MDASAPLGQAPASHDHRAIAMTDTILSLAAALADGRTTSLALTEAAIARIEDPAGEGARAFLRFDRETALAQARASDLQRTHGIVPSPLAGIPISVKDLFDVRGQVTTAGSTVLADAAPAEHDAAAIARLRAAGAVIIGRTNMTEFAFSGLGLNPHYGTPANPCDRSRIPGGSSSGAAVSVADGMAVAAIGSDTGGSIRIPAAFCRLAGFKPTQARVPRDGAFPLSWSLDSVGPIARSIACCAIIDAVLAGEEPTAPCEPSLEGLRLVVPRSYLLDGLDACVSEAFDDALDRLAQAGAKIEDRAMPILDRIPALNARGGLVTAEAYARHRELLEQAGDRYDPRVSSRIRRGAQQTAAEYIELTRARAALMAETDALTADADALVLPTVAIVPPRFDALQDDETYYRINTQVLRNTSAFNFLDRPAASVPCCGSACPTGLMIVGTRGQDRRLLAVARAVETAVS